MRINLFPLNARGPLKPLLVFLAGEVADTKAEAPKTTLENPKAKESMERAAKTIEGSKDYCGEKVASAKNQCMNVCEDSDAKVDSKLKALQGREISPEMVKSAPELVLGDPTVRQENPELARDAYREMVKSNPSGALALSSLYEGKDRNALIATALENALPQDPRAMEWESLLPKNAITPKLRVALANAKKADPFAAGRMQAA